MDFWSTTWSAVLGGVLTFVLTSLPMMLSERRRRNRLPTSDDEIAPQPTDDHSIDVDVSGENHGTITSRVEDNRSYKTSKKITKISHAPSRTNPTPTAVGGGDDVLGQGVAWVFLYVGVMLAVATVFVWAYPYLFILLSCFWGAVAGMAVAGSVQSYRVHGRWTHTATGTVIRTVAATAALIVVWVAVQRTVRGAMSLAAMNSTVLATPDPLGVPASNPIITFVLAGLERVKSFNTAYGLEGAGFAVTLLLSVCVVAAVLLALGRRTRVWAHALRKHGGEKIPKKWRRRVKLFARRSRANRFFGLAGVVAACVAAVALATGTGYDGYQNLIIMLSSSTAPTTLFP